MPHRVSRTAAAESSRRRRPGVDRPTRTVDAGISTRAPDARRRGAMPRRVGDPVAVVTNREDARVVAKPFSIRMSRAHSDWLRDRVARRAVTEDARSPRSRAALARRMSSRNCFGVSSVDEPMPVTVGGDLVPAPAIRVTRAGYRSATQPSTKNVAATAASSKKSSSRSVLATTRLSSASHSARDTTRRTR